MKIDHPEEFDAGLLFAQVSHDSFPELSADERGVLVEEYLEGPEITVDSVVWRGEVRPAFISHKRQDLPPTFEETGHLVVAEDPLLKDAALLRLVQAAHSAAGFEHGVTHAEVRLTAGGPKLVELNARLGGDLITYVGLLATGIDLAHAAATLAAGGLPDITPRRRGAAAVRFAYPPYDMILDEVRIRVEDFSKEIWLAKPLAQPGAVLRRPPGSFVKGRAALGFAVAADAQACDRALDALLESIEIGGSPLFPSAGRPPESEFPALGSPLASRAQGRSPAEGKSAGRTTDIVVLTDHASAEGSRPQLTKAVELLAGASPTLVDARRFFDGGEGRVSSEGGVLTLELPSENLVLRPSVVVVYEISPVDRRRFAAFQAVLARSHVATLGADGEAWQNATEKQLMMKRFERDHIPQMESIALVRPGFDTAADAFERLGGDVWTRPTIGWGGNDVFHVTNHAQLRMAVAHYAAAGMDWLVTRDAGNFDHRGRRHQFRVVVLGDRVLRVCEHVQDNPDAPCNESKGAVSTLLPRDALPADILRLAVRATRSLGLPFGGVDLALENGGVVFEVNVHPVIDVPRGLETLAIPLLQAHLAAAVPDRVSGARAMG